MKITMFLIAIGVSVLPLKAFAYVGPAIAGIFGSMIGLAGVIAISVVFVLAWPAAKLYMAWRNKKKEGSSEAVVDKKEGSDE